MNTQQRRQLHRPEGSIRFAGSLASPGLKASIHPRELARALDDATAAIIEDPLSFPWDAFDGDLDCPLIIDIAPCTDADRAALVPALVGLTPVDVIIDSTNPGSSEALQVATLVGATTDLPAVTEGPLLRSRKRMELAERNIVGRAHREFGDEVHVVSVPGPAIRANRGGMYALAAEHAPAGDWSVAGLWGIRSEPGDPLDRAVVVFRPMIGS